MAFLDESISTIDDFTLKDADTSGLSGWGNEEKIHVAVKVEISKKPFKKKAKPRYLRDSLNNLTIDTEETGLKTHVNTERIIDSDTPQKKNDVRFPLFKNAMIRQAEQVNHSVVSQEEYMSERLKEQVKQSRLKKPLSFKSFRFQFNVIDSSNPYMIKSQIQLEKVTVDPKTTKNSSDTYLNTFINSTRQSSQSKEPLRQTGEYSMLNTHRPMPNIVKEKALGDYEYSGLESIRRKKKPIMLKNLAKVLGYEHLLSEPNELHDDKGSVDKSKDKTRNPTKIGHAKFTKHSLLETPRTDILQKKQGSQTIRDRSLILPRIPRLNIYKLSSNSKREEHPH